MSGATITCCLCGNQFEERALVGTWLDRHCPHCRGKLSEEVYDEAAADVIARHRPQLGRKGARALDQLALARYYTSEWFRLACAGQGSKAADKGLFGLRPGYDPSTGTFQLTPSDDDRSPEGGLGTSAEYAVFDVLRRDVVDPASPLAGARLIPGLVFPWLPGQKPKQWGARHKAETDCVLLCRSFAVVVEVKRRGHHVRVSRGQNIRERSEQGSFRSASEPLEQVERGAESFAERQTLFAPERIFKLVVFVEPHSFEGHASSFRNHLLVSCLDANGRAPFIDALHRLATSLEPIASTREVNDLAGQMLEKFGNTKERRAGRIVCGSRSFSGSRTRRTAAMMKALEARCRDENSPLFGAHVLANLSCEVQVGQRGSTGRRRAGGKGGPVGGTGGKGSGSSQGGPSSDSGQGGKGTFTSKEVEITGLLLTRTHAIFIDARRWPVHVNTHAPFATVYTGDPAQGAEAIADDIRHDWDLASIRYVNRSHSLTLSNYVAKCMPEVDRYRERNRVCTLHVFIDPASYFTDCETFRQKSFLGYWRGRDTNVMAALEALCADAEPIMSQKALNAFARSIASIGEQT